jgi:hypothetical protein
VVQRAAELSAEEAERKKREAAYLEAGKMVRSGSSSSSSSSGFWQ